MTNQLKTLFKFVRRQGQVKKKEDDKDKDEDNDEDQDNKKLKTYVFTNCPSGVIVPGKLIKYLNYFEKLKCY